MNVKIIPAKLHGNITAMPSKSHAHRVLIAQKLAQLQGRASEDPLFIPEFSRDITATKNCLSQLGTAEADEGVRDRIPYLDCGESGSTLRFLLPVAMAVTDSAVFAGAGKLPHRPISPLKEEMENHGCCFSMAPGAGPDAKPAADESAVREICSINGRLQPGEYSLPGNISSQFITGLLFALPLLEKDSLLHITTKLESAGYVELSMDVLRDFGIDIQTTTDENDLITYIIPGRQQYTEPEGLAIEGDWSNAAFWLACGALGGNITCGGLKMDSSQRDRDIVRALTALGASVEISEDSDTGLASVTCSGPSPADRLAGIELDVTQIPDLVPVLAAVMSAADGGSVITGARRLRIKESDRLETVRDFLSRLGADIKCLDDGLVINGMQELEGGEVSSHNDHRIAMAAAVASCICRKPVIIRGADAVKKSYPGFFSDFTGLGGTVTEI